MILTLNYKIENIPNKLYLDYWKILVLDLKPIQEFDKFFIIYIYINKNIDNI